MKASDLATVKMSIMEPDGNLRAMNLIFKQWYSARLVDYNGIVVIDDIMRQGNLVGDYEDGDLILVNDYATGFKLISSEGEKIVKSNVLHLQVLSKPNPLKNGLDALLMLRVFLPE